MAKLIEKPPLGVRPAWFTAWRRIGELAEGILRQYECSDARADLCEKWAKEIVMQCEIIEQFREKSHGPDNDG